jgi:hypothetical protein
VTNPPKDILLVKKQRMKERGKPVIRQIGQYVFAEVIAKKPVNLYFLRFEITLVTVSV